MHVSNSAVVWIHAGQLSSSAEVYANNLKYIRDTVLPKGWVLNAVQKWNAYGHGINPLAPAAAKLGLSVSVLANDEAEQVIAASKAAGVAKPTVWRLMPADGPAKFKDVLEAARKGLDIHVSAHSSCVPCVRD